MTAAVLTTTVALAGCGGGGQSSSSGDDTIQFGVGDPQLQVGTAPYTSVPEEMGYFKDRGLTVDTQGTKGAVASVQGLLTGNFDIVNGGSTAFYQAAAKDDRIRVISLGADNIWHIAVPHKSDIKSVDDLKGKRIGSQSKSSASYFFGRSTLSSSGVDPDKDVKWLEVGVGAQAADALSSGKIEGYASYDGPLGVVDGLYDGKLRSLPSPVDDLSGTLGLATTKEFLEENPEKVQSFLEAFNDGKTFADANPSAAIQLHWKAYPAQAPKTGKLEQNVEDTMPVVQDRWKADAAPGTDGLVGYLSDAELKKSISFFAEHGLIDQEVSVEDVSGMATAKKAAEELDQPAIEKQAKAWKP